LPSDIDFNGDRMRRFVQEAKAAAALNHPNIAHIYEIGESDGTHFINVFSHENLTRIERLLSELKSLLPRRSTSSEHF
jgi:serine/threonine protein kinase